MDCYEERSLQTSRYDLYYGTLLGNLQIGGRLAVHVGVQTAHVAKGVRLELVALLLGL